MAKSYEPCYTKTDSKGNTYKTCEGAQKKRKAKAKLKKGGAPPPMVKKKKKVGVNETPEQNEQKAFLKLQSKKISQGFAGNNTGRINTGALNPAVQNLQVSPWQVQPEIQAQKPTYKIDTGLFMEGLATIVDVAKQRDYIMGALDEFGERKLTYQGVEYKLERDMKTITDNDGDVVGVWTGKSIDFINAGYKRFHDEQAGKLAPKPAPKSSFTYQDMAKSVFEQRGKEYAHVNIFTIGNVLWDGYNLYKNNSGRKGKKIGTYEDVSDLTHWRTYGDDDFTREQPLELTRRSKGLKIINR